jgi:hypothetical protein
LLSQEFQVITTNGFVGTVKWEGLNKTPDALPDALNVFSVFVFSPIQWVMVGFAIFMMFVMLLAVFSDID